MRKKALLISLLAGAILYFSNSSFAQYHTGGSSGDYGGATSAGLDDPFSQGDKFENIGVGFIGSGAGNALGSGFTTTSAGPTFQLNSEFALSDHFGLGFAFSYEHATASIIDTVGTYTQTYTETIKYSINIMQLNVRPAYHFSAGDKLDPYVGIGIGYCVLFAPETITSSDPYATPITNTAGTEGFEFGGFAGARYFFSDHVGAWVEIQYFRGLFSYDTSNTASGTSVNSSGSATASSANILTSNFINLGICFKY
jgi:outer membrane protein W